MARNRIPTSMRSQEALAHDPQRARERANEPIPSGPLGDPPDFFVGDDEYRARLRPLFEAAWRELAEQVPAGVLTIMDRDMVEMYCRLKARMRAGEPLKAAEQNLMLRCLSLMGMTPSDRSKLSVARPPEPQELDEFAKQAAQPRVALVTKIGPHPLERTADEPVDD